MLQRAAETVSGDDECNDPAVLLACALGSTGCPAKCAEKEGEKSTINPYEGVQAGDLNVAVSTSSSVTSIPYKWVIKVAELAVKASENIQLQSIDVTRLGLAANKGIKVWIEKDGKRISSSSSLFWDASTSLTFNNNGYVVNGNETLDLIVSLDGTQTAGAELQFKVSNLVSSAKNSTISPDTTGVFRTTTYEATSVTVEGLNTSNEYDLADDVEFSFGEFKVLNDSKASDERNVLIRNITFKLDNGNFDNLGSFKLLRDSKEVSSKYTIDGKSLTFVLNDQLDSGKSATYKLVAKPSNIEKEGGDDYRFIINKDADVIAEEIGSNASAYRVSVKFVTETIDDEKVNKNVLGSTKIKWGNFTLTKDSNFASTVNVNWGYSDTTIAKGTFKANQAVKYEWGFVLAKKDLAEDASLTGIVRRATLKIGSRTYQLDVTKDGLKSESEIYVDRGTHDVELQISLITNPEEDDTVESFSFKDIAWDCFKEGKYLNTDETNVLSTSVAGSIRTAKISISEQKMGLKKDGPADDVKIAQGTTDEKLVLEWTITNTTDKELSISKLVITGQSYNNHDVNEKGWADVYVVLWDKTSSRVSYSADDFNAEKGKAREVGVSTTLNAGNSVKFQVYVMPKASLEEWSEFRFDVAVEWKSEGNTLGSSSLKSAVVKVNPGATVTTVAQSAKNKVIFPGVSTEIASFDYTVENDNAEIKTFEITSKDTYFNADDLNGLTVDFGGKVGAPALSYEKGEDNTIVATFNTIQSIPEGKYTVKVYATFEESAIRGVNHAATDDAPAYVEVQPKKISKLAFFDWNGDEKGEVVYANKKEITHIIAKAYPVLNRESFSRDKDAPSLELGVTKVEKDNTSAVVAITAIGGTYSWSDEEEATPLFNINNTGILKKASSALDFDNISTSKGLLRGSVQKIAVSDISFTVKAGNDLLAVYNEKSSDTIADFATLTNE